MQRANIGLGLGLAACQRGLSVGFNTASALVHELLEARDEKRLLRLQRQLAGFKVLIVDELGYVPLSRTGVMSEAIVHQYGRDELLRRLAHPFWFQSFGAVMGMDWHSSGITTSVIGALKRGLASLSNELGIHVCGGRGKHSRQTPQELVAIGERVGFDGSALANTSRLVAKVDSAAVQDGFDLYLHGFIVTNDGQWVVVQQGMNGDRKQARRYHWLSEGLKSFVEEPHSAIDGVGQGEIINLTDRRASALSTVTESGGIPKRALS